MRSLSLAAFLAGVGSGLVVAAPIGPMGVLCIQRTLAFGLAAGLATGLGAATVHLIFASIAVFGLGPTLMAWLGAGTQTVLSLLSASLLFWIAVRIASRTVVVGSPVQRRAGWLKAYGSALVVGLTNPLTLVLFAASLPVLAASDDLKTMPALVSGVFLGSAV